MTATKSIIADLNQGDKLNEKNYDVWHRKLQYLLEDQDVLETIDHIMHEPEQGTSAQHRRDLESYQVWKKKNRVARILLLSSMRNDIMLRFEKYKTALEVWDAVKDQYGGTSTTRLRQLTLRFDGYKKRHDHTMRQHLTAMSNMISELRSAGHELTNEQQVQSVIRSLPNSWEHLRINLTHNDNIKNFDDVSRHVELEEDRLMAEKPTGEANMVETSSRKGFGPRRKRARSGDGKESGPNHKKAKFAKRNRGKRGGKKDKTKMACFKCSKLGHFARDCTEAEIQQQPTT